MKVNRKELLEVLGLVIPGLARREIVEQTKHFIFTGRAVATFNDQVCIIHPYESDIAFSVRGEEFYKILEKDDSENVEIVTDRSSVKIKGGRLKATLVSITDEKNKVDYLIDEISKSQETNKWKTISDNLVTGLKLCAFSASKDLSTGAYAAVHINGKTITSTDRYRISRYTLPEWSMKKFAISAKDAEVLADYPILSYQLGENWVHFSTGTGVTFSCRLIMGELPVLDAFFEMDKSRVVKLPNSLAADIDSISFMASGTETGKEIEFELTKGLLYIRARDEKGGDSIEKRIECDYNDFPICIRVNPNFLSQILQRTTEFALSETENRAIFLSDNFEHVISVKRV